MEPRFGHDFGRVRVHTDSRAASSAQEVNALAYTVGQEVVFGSGQYARRTNEGRRLLAHELAHVVQQQDVASHVTTTLAAGEPERASEQEADSISAAIASEAGRVVSPSTRRSESPPLVRQRPASPMVSRAWNACGKEDDCPAREPGERGRARSASLQVGTLTAPETGVIVSHFDIGSSSVATLSSNPVWTSFSASLGTEKIRWEILGFSDCEGGTETNSEVRLRRATAVNNALPAPAQAKIDRFQAALLTDCVAENDTEEHRALNRSVVFRQTVTEITFPDEPVTVVGCPPASSAAVTSLSDYISLLACAERQTSLGPRDMLAMLRQLYYGKPWSSVSTTDKWDNVIPCSPDLGHPASRLGTNLYNALRNSSEVAGVDVGHVFTGLEAMTCPSPEVSLFGGLYIVDMSNEEFATWGGDLGAAVAAYVACPQLGASAATNDDCGGRTGSQPLSFYIGLHASPQDLEGDIDSFVMRANLIGIPCTGSAQRTFTPSRPMSEIFFEYYNDPLTSLGTAHDDRYRCFLQAIGATVSGNRITNVSTIQGPIAARVANFADPFFTRIKGGGFLDLSDVGDRTHMRMQAWNVTDWFLSYVERKL